jgi:1-aminocyclopropane-1-carboxylate deaminase
VQEIIIRLHTIEWTVATDVQVCCTFARLDEIHPVVCGNKYFKLKYNLQRAIAEGKGIITMGGAYSNHLAATAFACNEAGIHSIGLVRGEVKEPLNHTLSFCVQQNMKLIPVPRHAYSRTSAYIQTILAEQKDFLFVPEGGDNAEGEKGCSEIPSLIKNFNSFTHILCAVGTGTTLRGLAQSLLPNQTVMAIPVLKIKEKEQPAFVQQHLTVQNQHQLSVLFEYAGKGYASQEPRLFDFMNSFFSQTGIPLDFVYTAKLMMAVTDLLEKHYFSQQDRLLVIHTGGLQGNESLPPGTLLY